MIQVCLSILFIRSLLFYWISTPHGTVIPPLHSLTAPLHCSLLTFLAFPSTSFLLGAINVDLYRDLPVLRGVFGSDAELAGAVHNSVRHYRHNYSVEPTLYFHNLLGLVVFGGVFGGGVVSRGWELWKRAQAARTEPGVGGLLKSVRNVGKISDYLIIGSYSRVWADSAGTQ